MRRSLYSFLLAILFLAASISAQDNSAILKELLDLPAPRPAEPEKPEKKYGDVPPPDDAPIEELKGYWSAKAGGYYVRDKDIPRSSVQTAMRLIENARRGLGNFDDLLKIFPAHPQVAEEVKRMLDSAPPEEVSDNWREKVKDWIKFNSNLYIDEVAADALKAKDHREYTRIIYGESVRALALYDWETAQPLLERFENDRSNPRTAVLALQLIYEHAVREKDEETIREYREKLQKIVEDRSAKASVRDIAMGALAGGGDWPGIEDWYVGLLEDPSLAGGSEGSHRYDSLETFSAQDPDRWIPILTKLVGDKNRALHNSAVSNLLQFEKRKDALLPLVPWLSDPKWANGKNDKLISAMGDLDLPEAIPGLIWVVENDEEQEAILAAVALGKKKERSAGPVILARIGQIKTDRKLMIDALIACQGLTDAEMVQAIQSFAILVLKPGMAERVDRGDYDEDEGPLPVSVSIGRFLAREKSPPENFVRSLYSRIKDLRKTQPDVAAKLHQIADAWQGKAVYSDMLQRAADGDLDGPGMINILARRKHIREEAPLELTWITAKSGLRGALGLAVLEDASALQGLINPETPEDAAAALAFARLVQVKLQVRDITPLLKSNNKLLALAAERYLEAENSFEGRQAIFEKYSGKIRVLGAREFFEGGDAADKYSEAIKAHLFSFGQYSSGRDYSGMDKAENHIRLELEKDKDLLHVYAMISGDPAGHVLRVYKDRATFTIYESGAYYRQKTLTREELDSFQTMLAEMDIDNLRPAHGGCHHNCYGREFVSIGRDGGFRVFAYAGIFALGILDLMEILFERTGYKVHYYLESEIKGFEVLFGTEEDKVPIAFWKDGSDMRLLISDAQREREIRSELNKIDDEERKNEDLGFDERRKSSNKRYTERQNEHLSWYRFSEGKLTVPAAEPAEIPYLYNRTAFPHVDNFYVNNNVVQTLSRGYDVRTGNDGDSGLVLLNSTSMVVIRKDGWYNDPLTTADGRWAVVKKTESGWSSPHRLYRLDLASGREYRIALDPHKELAAVSFIGAHAKMLVRRAGTYFLLDVNTGALQQIKNGEFRPLRQQTYRGLQPTGQPGEFWAAIPNEEKNETEIGKYDTKAFAFKPVIKLPKIVIESTDIWVDEKKGFIYIIYGGARFHGRAHLLRLPLNAAPLK